MTRRAALPDPLLSLPFSAAVGYRAGLSRSRLRSSDLASLFHGVRAALELPDRLEWLCRSYQERMRRGDVFSHTTAALLYGLPLPLYLMRAESQDDVSRIVHVAARAPLRAPEGRAVVGHRIPETLWSTRDVVYRDPETLDIFAFSAVTPELAWAQLGASLDLADLVALGDAISRSSTAGTLIDDGKPLGTIIGFAQIAEKWAPRQGSARLRAAAPLVRLGSLSRPESLCRLQIVSAGIPEPQLNVRVTDLVGRDIAMADLSWPEYRVLVEYEGDGHRTSTAKFRSDVTRGELYADGGWHGLRATAEDVFGDPNPFIGRLARALEARGWRPPPHELRQIAGARP